MIRREEGFFYPCLLPLRFSDCCSAKLGVEYEESGIVA